MTTLDKLWAMLYGQILIERLTAPDDESTDQSIDGLANGTRLQERS